MRKRSKTEVEIRNILSEILLDSLTCSSKVDNLNLIRKYCGNAGDHAIDRIYLKDLLPDSGDSNLGEIYEVERFKDVLVKRLFVSGPGNSINLKSRYAKYRTFICRKINAYLKFLSRRGAGTGKFHNKFQDKLEVGVMLFNGGFFFECHEYLEEIWLNEKGREKAFLKGLIHACVAFYHLEFENIRGTVNYLKRSSARLREFRPNFLGVDVSNFLSDVERYLKSLDEFEPKYVKAATPRIKLIK